MMADIRETLEALPYFDFGHTPTRVDADTFTVATDLTATYTAGKQLKFVGATTEYAIVTSSSYSAPNTTVEVSGTVPTSLSTVSVGITAQPEYRRTAAEIAAGVTPVNYAYESVDDALGNAGRHAVGDWNGSTGTDDSTALRNACLVIQQRGGGVLDLGSGRYRIFSDGSTATIGDFSNLRGIKIKASGAELVIDRTFTGSQTVTLFEFAACNNIDFEGSLTLTCTAQPAGEKTTRGPVFAEFSQGCLNVRNGTLKATGCRILWHIIRDIADPVSYISKNFDLGVTYATSCGYPLNTSGASGQNVKAILHTDTCGRSYFPQGAKGHDITVFSKNHEASVDCLLVPDGTTGIESLKLKYINRESTSADASLNCVRLEIQDSDLYDSVSRDIDISLNIETGASTYLGYGFEIGKLKADSTADATDRGHIIEKLRLSGVIRAGNSSQRSVGMFNIGTWSTGELIRNISVEDLVITGTGQPTFNFASLQDTAVFKNVYSSAQMNVTGNTTGKITCINVECDGSITAASSDVTYQTYIDCKVGSSANQAVDSTKAFEGRTTVQGNRYSTIGGVNYNMTAQALSGAGAVGLTTWATHITTTAANALTLADGVQNQQKMLVMVSDGGAGTLTPTNLYNGTTITFDDVGDSAHLVFLDGQWCFMGGTATLA